MADIHLNHLIYTYSRCFKSSFASSPTYQGIQLPSLEPPGIKPLQGAFRKLGNISESQKISEILHLSGFYAYLCISPFLGFVFTYQLITCNPTARLESTRFVFESPESWEGLISTSHTWSAAEAGKVSRCHLITKHGGAKYDRFALSSSKAPNKSHIKGMVLSIYRI